MEANLPAPLVPAEVDLRNFPFTPMFRARLFGSQFHARSTDAEWRAGVTLWLKSWDQVPCGSLPDDDVDLCRLAEFGRDLKSWRKVKLGALHGWIKCSDGRLYHGVVAEGVNEAWQSKQAQRDRTAAARRARQEQRESQTPTTPPSASATKAVTPPVTSSVSSSVTEPVTASNRTEQNRQRESPATTESGSREADERLIAGRFLALRDELWPGSMPLASLTIQAQSGEFLAMGLDESELWTLLDRGARRHAEAGKSVINSLRYFRNAVLDAVAEQQNRQRLNGNGHAHEKAESPAVVTWRVWIKNWLEKDQWHESQRITDCPRQVLEDNRPALEAKPPPGMRVKSRPSSAGEVA